MHACTHMLHSHRHHMYPIPPDAFAAQVSVEAPLSLAGHWSLPRGPPSACRVATHSWGSGEPVSAGVRRPRHLQAPGRPLLVCGHRYAGPVRPEPFRPEVPGESDFSPAAGYCRLGARCAPGSRRRGGESCAPPALPLLLWGRASLPPPFRFRVLLVWGGQAPAAQPLLHPCSLGRLSLSAAPVQETPWAPPRVLIPRTDGGHTGTTATGPEAPAPLPPEERPQWQPPQGPPPKPPQFSLPTPPPGALRLQGSPTPTSGACWLCPCRRALPSAFR